jgi:hypothetical protein
MPYKIEKSGSGWFVVNKNTHQRKNKKPHPTKSAAAAHMRALYQATANESYDAVVLRILSEMETTQSSSNPMGATTTGKLQQTAAPTSTTTPVPADVDLASLDDKNVAHIQDVCKKMNKPYNATTHNEIALMIQNAKKEKASKPQTNPATNLTQPTQTPQQPSVASAAPSTSYSAPQQQI